MIYESKPKDFNPGFEAAGCFIEYKKKFLLLQRQDNKPYEGTWGLPGGKRDKGETIEECITREILEETGFKVETKFLRYLNTVYVENENNVQYFYHMFRVSFKKQKTPTLREIEHKAYIWTNPIDALKLPLIPDQDFCIKLVYNLCFMRYQLADDICNSMPQILTKEQVNRINKIKSAQKQEDMFLMLTGRTELPHIKRKNKN